MVPVEPSRLALAIETVLPGLEECCRHSLGEATPQQILRLVAMDQARLFLFLGHGNEYLGFIVFQLQVYPSAKFLLIWCLYTNPSTGVDVLAEFNEDVDALARLEGCSKIVFLTDRKTNRVGVEFDKRVAPMGYRPFYMQYVKEL